MANSMTETIFASAYNDAAASDKRILDEERIFRAPSKSKYTDSAPRFKYQMNFPEKDLENIRKLLKLERKNQSQDDYDFWTADYERMLVDDWLVTRFLLRGLKASQRAKIDSSSFEIKRIEDFLEQGGETEVAKSIQDENILALEPLYWHTIKLVRACAKFRKDYGINPMTKAEEFPIDWLQVNGLFVHKPDLAGNQTIYLRISLHKPKLIETKELRLKFKRLLLYTLEKCDQKLMNNMGKGVCCIFDMGEATFENVDLELASWMIKSFKQCSPKLLAYVIVYNLPWFFSATFKLLTTKLMSNAGKQCLKFVYGDEILKYIDYPNLPDYIRDNL